MKTSFSPQQLSNPFFSEAESIMRKCVHCGLCTATCSSYVILGDERASPRGRVYLINKMLEKNERPSKATVHFLDNCLTCLSCMTTCPSGVDYVHLIDMARAHANKKVQRPLPERLMRSFLANLLPYPKRLKPMMLAGRMARPLQPLLRKVGLNSMSTMMEALPRTFAWNAHYRSRNPARGPRSKRVVLFPGCTNDLMRPSINEATVALLTRMGVEVLAPSELGCCGAIEHHLGEEEKAIRSAKRNVDILSKLHRDQPLDAIVITASGCGSTIKDYGRLLRDEPGHAARAEDIANLAKDVTEVLATTIRQAPRQWGGIKVAYHSSCSLEHGQRVRDEPRKLLEQAGFIVLEVPEGHLCCGAAGTYSILQPTISKALRDRKLANIDTLEPDVIAAGNIGCINHMEKESNVPIVHTVELLDWAFGGACPKGLRHLEEKVTRVDGVMADSVLEEMK